MFKQNPVKYLLLPLSFYILEKAKDPRDLNISMLGGFGALICHEKTEAWSGFQPQMGHGMFFFPRNLTPKTKITGGFEKILVRR